MARELVPLLLADLMRPAASAETGFGKFYLRQGNLRLVRPGEMETDVVLNRRLEAYQKAARYRAITQQDDVRTAISLLEAGLGQIGGGGGVLTQTIDVQGVTVGNLDENTVLEQGMTMTEIFLEMLRKRNAPLYNPPSASWRATPYQPYYEIGFRLMSVLVELLYQQNDGGIALGGAIFRNGVLASNSLTFTDQYIATTAVQSYQGYINHEAGPLKADNLGTIDPNDPNRIPAGQVVPGSLEWRGVYPWFSGISQNAGGPTGAEIYQSRKTVEPVGSLLQIPTFGPGIQYLWFAVPVGSPSYHYWFRSVLNQAQIGTGQDLFNTPTRLLVTSTGMYQNWSHEYELYVSNYQTEATQPMRISTIPF